MKKQFRVLMVNEQFIDFDRLTKGLYVTDKPKLFSLELTPQRLFEDNFEEIIMNGSKKNDVDRFHDNWNKCDLKTIEIQIL